MTNTEAEPLSTITGTEAETTLDADKFISNRGTEFEIKTLPSGLFYIHMKAGGAVPPLCSELFTSRKLAEQSLIRYIQSKEKSTGVAQYPGKGRNGKSKN